MPQRFQPSVSLYNKRRRLCTLSCSESTRTVLAAYPLGCHSHWNNGVWPDLQTVATPNPIFCLWEFNDRWVINCWTDTTVDSMCPFIFIMLYENDDANPAFSRCQSSSDICALLIVCWSQKIQNQAFKLYRSHPHIQLSVITFHL